MAENIEKVVIDSSFLLSTILPDEKILPLFQEYVKKFRQNKLIFSSCELLKYEICNSLKSAVKRKRISSKRANILRSAFELMEIEYQSIDFGKTMELSVKHDLSFYDASYLYLAKANKCKLLTLDKKLQSFLK